MGDKKPGSETSVRTTPLSKTGAEAQLRELYSSVLEQNRRLSLLIYHRDGAQMVPLDPGRPLVLGRASEADLVVRDPSLSREHARFELRDDELWLEDLRSTNGTRVNGHPVERAKVRAGDEIAVGAVPVSIHQLPAVECSLYGLESHDGFVVKLGQEVERAVSTGHGLALLMVRALGEQGDHLGWLPRVRKLLRRFDRAALFGPGEVELLLPEADAALADEIAAKIAVPGGGEPALACAVALAPAAGSSVDELLDVVRTALKRARPDTPVRRAPSRGTRTLEVVPREPDDGGPVLRDPAMVALYETVQRVATSAIPVLINGETGSGKELVARAIHERGPRRDAALSCVNCGALPASLVESTLFGHERGAFTGAAQAAKGVFEAADGGTVLLDEIGELPADAQAALLRVLETRRVVRVGSTQEREVDVRVVAATHRDLEAMCSEGTFRQDLLYRLNVMTLEVPPLRERAAEILPLAERFLEQASSERPHRLTDEARTLLQRHRWPGNVRELKNAMDRAVVIATSELIGVDDLPQKIRDQVQGQVEPAEAPAAPAPAAPAPEAAGDAVSAAPPAAAEEAPLKDQVKQYEAMLIRNALDRCHWNTRDAAEELGLPLRTLNHKMKQHGISKPKG